MANVDRLRIVTELFAAVGPAHHQAFIETDGEDPEWPLFYAQYLQQPLSDALGLSLTQSEIVQQLLNCEALRTAKAPDAQWSGYCSTYFVAVYPAA